MYFDVNILVRYITISENGLPHLFPSYSLDECYPEIEADDFPCGLNAVDESDALTHLLNYLKLKLPLNKANTFRIFRRDCIMDVECISKWCYITLYEVILHEKSDK